MKKKEVHVELFGNETQVFEVKAKSVARALFELITGHLDIHEQEYFGIYILLKNDQRKWLRMDKEIKKQLKEPWIVKFGVKLYPPVVSDLIEEITRFYIYQQLREDIAKGILLSSFVTHSLLGSLAAQAELGNHGLELDDEQLSALRLAPNMSPALLSRIKELHRSHRCMSTNAAEMRYLETASKLALYGLHQFHVKDGEEAHIILSVFAGGIVIFEKGILLNRFTWGAIIELSYKRSVFYIQVRAGVVGNNVSRVGFLCPTSGTAKRIWRIAVEHHHFFRKEKSIGTLEKTQSELITTLDFNENTNQQSLLRARTVRSSRYENRKQRVSTCAVRAKTNSPLPRDDDVEMARPGSISVPSSSLSRHESLSTSDTNTAINMNSTIQPMVPPPKPLRRSRMNLNQASSTPINSAPSTPSKSGILACSSPVSSCSEPNEARVIIAQIHSEDNWSEEIKIDETSMNNASMDEEKPEQGRCSGGNESIKIKERSNSGTNQTSQSTGATMRRLRTENRSRSLLQLRRSFMEN